MTPKEMAKVVHRTFDIHEGSWNEKRRMYDKDMRTAVEEAVAESDVPSEFALPIYLAFEWPNDLGA